MGGHVITIVLSPPKKDVTMPGVDPGKLFCPRESERPPGRRDGYAVTKEGKSGPGEKGQDSSRGTSLGKGPGAWVFWEQKGTRMGRAE